MRPEMAKHYAAVTLQPLRVTPEEMTARIKSESSFWAAMIKKLGIKPEA